MLHGRGYLLIRLVGSMDALTGARRSIIFYLNSAKGLQEGIFRQMIRENLLHSNSIPKNKFSSH